MRRLAAAFVLAIGVASFAGCGRAGAKVQSGIDHYESGAYEGAVIKFQAVGPDESRLRTKTRARYLVYRGDRGATAALRLLPMVAPRLEELHLPVSLSDLGELSSGLVIVCGPTGSGKSAMLAALACEVLDRRTVVLMSLEELENDMEQGDL